jgi:hypothetical protein
MCLDVRAKHPGTGVGAPDAQDQAGLQWLMPIKTIIPPQRSAVAPTAARWYDFEVPVFVFGLRGSLTPIRTATSLAVVMKTATSREVAVFLLFCPSSQQY